MNQIFNINSKDQIFLDNYFNSYKSLLLETDIRSQLFALRDLCLQVKSSGKKIIFIGNGASASIASHAATDFTQHAGVRSIALNDHNLITAFGNDYGYQNWITKALEAYADNGDVIVLISSSGKSPNVVNAAYYAKQKGLCLVTFTGFSPDNSLRTLSSLAFWANSTSYNIIECTHLIWILMVVDLLEFGESKLNNGSIPEIVNQLNSAIDYSKLLAFRDLCKNVSLAGGKMIYLGNGGSSSIASHAATDFTKQSKIRSVAFNDHNLLTCFSNDFGYDQWMVEALKAYSDPVDAIVLISSSGRSINILNAADTAHSINLPIITFSSFDSDNPLRARGKINFWVNSYKYGVAAAIHSILIFTVADLLR
jgi:D-sedoheptulose 7-phosphate isomerase